MKSTQVIYIKYMLFINKQLTRQLTAGAGPASSIGRASAFKSSDRMFHAKCSDFTSAPWQLKRATLTSLNIIPLRIINAYKLTNHNTYWTRTGLYTLLIVKLHCRIWCRTTHRKYSLFVACLSHPGLCRAWGVTKLMRLEVPIEFQGNLYRRRIIVVSDSNDLIESTISIFN